MKTETYACQACGIDVVRPVARGQRPKWCPECRRRDRTARLCEWCGSKPAGKRMRHCSRFCGMAARSRPVMPLPKSHPVMQLLAPPKEPRPKRSPAYAWRTARECPGCACVFTPLYTPRAVMCSKRCARRVSRWRRKAAERSAPGSFTWGDFMRIAQRFGFCCAYCGQRSDAQLEPDHVVPLSRGGYNSTANLLPSCRPCNGDKRDLLLSEWNEDRKRRGLPPRLVTWAPDDKRFTHLTQTVLMPEAA